MIFRRSLGRWDGVCSGLARAVATLRQLRRRDCIGFSNKAGSDSWPEVWSLMSFQPQFDGVVERTATGHPIEEPRISSRHTPARDFSPCPGGTLGVPSGLAPTSDSDSTSSLTPLVAPSTAVEARVPRSSSTADYPNATDLQPWLMNSFTTSEACVRWRRHLGGS